MSGTAGGGLSQGTVMDAINGAPTIGLDTRSVPRVLRRL